MKTIDYTESFVYSITICTANKLDIFSNEKYARLAIEVIKDYSERFGIVCFACCVMPDHIHLTLMPEGKYSIPETIGFIKGRISYLISRDGFKSKVWQRGFYDHVLREPEKLEVLIKYILENPVRKGLVDRLSDYPWSFDRYGIKDSNT